jgi:excisionase family DNA binding protein
MKDRKSRPTRIKSAPPATPRNTPFTSTTGDGSEAPLLTLTEAAFRLGRVHRTTIMRWVKEGRLRCVRLSRKAILFEIGEIDRFIREHRYSGH